MPENVNIINPMGNIAFPLMFKVQSTKEGDTCSKKGEENKGRQNNTNDLVFAISCFKNRNSCIPSLSSKIHILQFEKHNS